MESWISDATGYVPVIADRMFCWGELHRRIMTEAGQDPAKLAIGGCPRLTRELLAEPAEGAQPIEHRSVAPRGHAGHLAGPAAASEAFGSMVLRRRVIKLDGVSRIVRLHPSESLEFYADIAREYPQVKFMDNSQLSLDESLAATDVVVVQSSGLGSDALVKRRLVVVVEIPNAPLDHGKDLIEQAGCPRAASAEQLAVSLRRLLFDEEARRRHFAATERFVEKFCAYFGGIRPGGFLKRFCKPSGPRAEVGDEAMVAGKDRRSVRVSSETGARPQASFP